MDVESLIYELESNSHRAVDVPPEMNAAVVAALRLMLANQAATAALAASEQPDLPIDNR